VESVGTGGVASLSVTAEPSQASPPPIDETTAWSEIPVVEQRPPSRYGRLLGQLLMGGVVVAVLCLLGHYFAAIVLSIVIVTISIASLFSERANRAIERVMQAVRRLTGRALSVLLLGILEVLVFAPISVFFRLIGRDPLALDLSLRASTRWRPHPAAGRRNLYRRQFAYERPPRATADRSLYRSTCIIFGTVTLILLADLGVGSILDAFIGPITPSVTAPGNLFRSGIRAVPRSAPWWQSVLQETYAVGFSSQFAPYRGWSYPNYSSQYTNITSGIRKSWEPPAISSGSKPVEVAFFGGSTMEGAYQRDNFTIASDVAKLAYSKHVAIHVTNYGQQGYAAWQELEQLEELLTAGYRPNVVVFYDGINDLYAQANSGTSATPTYINADKFRQAAVKNGATSNSGAPSLGSQIYDSYSNHSLILRLSAALGLSSPQPPSGENQESGWSPDQSIPTALTRASDAVSIHERAINVLTALGAHYGFRAISFWQPYLYTKTVVPGEQAASGLLAENPAAWRAMASESEKELKPPVIDLTKAFNSSSQPVMIDFMHTNELGAQLVANAMYPYLLPAIGATTPRGSSP
jgi:lysophospholipase L1-like esterase